MRESFNASEQDRPDAIILIAAARVTGLFQRRSPKPEVKVKPQGIFADAVGLEAHGARLLLYTVL
jgi:hypothetical protein